MRTTLNLPDPLVLKAKRQALEERSNLTTFLVEGLALRLDKANPRGQLPVSTATNGLCEGVSWDDLQVAEPGEEYFR